MSTPDQEYAAAILAIEDPKELLWVISQKRGEFGDSYYHMTNAAVWKRVAALMQRPAEWVWPPENDM